MEGLCFESFSGPMRLRRSSSTARPAPPPSLSIDLTVESPENRLVRVISENPVVIFCREACCLCHVVKRLLAVLGVHPIVVELDDAEVMEMTESLAGGSVSWAGGMAPLVFIGGKPVGSVENLMGFHLSGQLLPQLREAGALQM